MVAQAKLKSRCEIKESLGQGGIGVVCRAYDTVIRDFALETIRDIPDPAALETFQKECGVLASMAHPNIIEIFDLGEFASAAQVSIQGLADLAPRPITEDRPELSEGPTC